MFFRCCFPRANPLGQHTAKVECPHFAPTVSRIHPRLRQLAVYVCVRARTTTRLAMFVWRWQEAQNNEFTCLFRVDAEEMQLRVLSWHG